ncbi:hypothetical protein ACHAWX_001848 [Stephanocyclus meneghinianus]
MERSESHYLFNKLYVDPLIWWVQNSNENDFAMLGEEILQLLRSENDANDNCDDGVKSHSDIIGKRSIGLGLIELEESLYNEQDNSSSDADCDSSSNSLVSTDVPHELSDNNDIGQGSLVQLMQSLDVERANIV